MVSICSSIFGINLIISFISIITVVIISITITTTTSIITMFLFLLVLDLFLATFIFILLSLLFLAYLEINDVAQACPLGWRSGKKGVGLDILRFASCNIVNLTSKSIELVKTLHRHKVNLAYIQETQ